MGKTKVARLYGRMLKDFGYLSDGDLVETTPSQLMGSAVGEAAANINKLFDENKGKVVFVNCISEVMTFVCYSPGLHIAIGYVQVIFIDEAYNLDPARTKNQYGGDVLNTLVFAHAC